MSEGIIYITRTQQDEPNYYKVGRTTLSSTDQRTRHEQTYTWGGLQTIRAFNIAKVIAAETAAQKSWIVIKVTAKTDRAMFNDEHDMLQGKETQAKTAR